MSRFDVIGSQNRYENAHALYDAMRAVSPIVLDAMTGTWFVTGYRLCAGLLRDNRLSAQRPSFTANLSGSDRDLVENLERFYRSWMVFSDPPYQSAVRRAAAPQFHPAAVSAVRDGINERARSLLSTVRTGSDLHARFSVSLAQYALFDFLGIRGHHHERLARWSRDIMAWLEVPWADPEVAAVSMASVEQLRLFVQSTLIDQAVSPYAEIGDEAAAALFAQVLTGGLEPVAASLTSLSIELIRDPSTVFDLRTGALTTEAVVEESLRLDAPFHFVPRRAAQGIEIADTRITAGERVVLVIAAANRDPGVYESPARFRVGRAGPPHLAFGAGSHYCLGAALARLTLNAAVTPLVEWLEQTNVAGIEAHRGPSFGTTIWREARVIA